MTFPVKYPYYIVVFDLQKKGYTKMIHIRLASKEDIQNIMPLYAYARKFMAANGNPHQWNGNYPASKDILKDIAMAIIMSVRRRMRRRKLWAVLLSL